MNCKIVYNQYELEGCGYAENKNLALVKALSEMLERCCLVDNNITHSNGLAAGPSLRIAKENAISELIERDLFFSIYLTNSTKFKLSQQQLENIKTPIFNSLYLFSKQNKINLESYILGTVNEFLGLAIIAYGEKAPQKFGLSIGLSCSKNIKKNFESAAIECLRKVVWTQKTNKIKSLNLKEFLRIKNPCSMDHTRLALNLEYAELFKQNWNQKCDSKKYNDYSLKNLDINTVELFLDKNIFRDVPITFARAQSDKLQNVIVGLPNIKKLNMSRLESFYESASFEINRLPHPL